MKRITIAIIVLITTSCIILCIFHYSKSHSPELMKYHSFILQNHYPVQQKTRTFDSAGIIMQDNRYHPLTIAHYGVNAYDAFLETQDSIHYFRCVNQYKYFKDTTKTNLILGNRGIGLPYNFNLWDLKSPWYSGMTQGVAISYLLRYHHLTADESAFAMIPKIAYVLISPQSEGGTISTTAEGCTWIEEYPRSKTSPQVLNGAINGLIGLKEYCDFFPSDLKAKAVLDEVYEGIKYSLEYFNTPTWGYYHRKNKTISNHYLRYQMYEMEHLNKLFNEPLFDHQMRIWAVHFFKKAIKQESALTRFNNHSLSQPAKTIDSMRFGVPITSKELMAIKEKTPQVFNSWSSLKSHVECKGHDNYEGTKDKALFLFRVIDTSSANYLKITFDTLIESFEITLFSSSPNKPTKFNQIDFQLALNKNIIDLYFADTVINSFVVVLSKKKAEIPAIQNINFYYFNSQKSPPFVHKTTEPIDLISGVEYSIDLPVFYSKNVTIFYKSATEHKSLANSKWLARNTCDRNTNFIAPKSGVYQFMIVLDRESPLSSIGKFNITQANIAKQLDTISVI